MKKKTFFVIVTLAILSICGFLVIQVFWLGKAFDLSNKQFEHNVNMALLNVSSKLCEVNQNEMLPDPIEQLSSNYFVVNLNNRIAPEILESILKSEFKKREITDDFEYGIFDCANEEMVYGNRIVLSGDEQAEAKISSFPELSKDAYYFGVYFPFKPSNLAGEMWIWGFSSLVLLIVVLFFGFALFTIIRQRQLSEIQRDFINNMTHEFKTPISTIALSSTVLASEEIASQPSRLSKYANIIHTESTRLQHQVERVLQIASLDSNKVALNIQSVDCLPVIQQAVDSARLRLDENGSVEMKNQLQKAVFRVDPVHFSNVMSNLLDNAIKYNAGSPKIEISLDENEKGLTITVADNGIGIPKKSLDLIFKKFYRVPTGNLHDVKGFGLGLYYVKSVMAAHGGKINVQSSPEGSKFSLTFPNHHG